MVARLQGHKSGPQSRKCQYKGGIGQALSMNFKHIYKFTFFILILIGFPKNICCANDAITLTSLAEREIVQRSLQNTALLPIEGAVTGQSTLIEARAIPLPGFPGLITSWTLIDDTIENGSFSGTLEVSSGWYSIELRGIASNTQVVSAALSPIGIGDVLITAGQSNSANRGSPPQIPDLDCVSARLSPSANIWQLATDPQPIASGDGGSPWPQLGDLLVGINNVPVGFVSLGVSGTRVDQWLPGTTNYDNRLRETIKSLMSHGGFKAILWHQGESDSLAGTSSNDYKFRLQQIIAQSRIDAGWDVPWGVALASYYPGSSLLNQSQIIIGQQSVINEDPLVFKGAYTDDFHLIGFLHDAVHFNQQGLDEHAARWAASLTSYFSTIDSDGDGIQDWRELLCGSNPADGDSRCKSAMPGINLLLLSD